MARNPFGFTPVLVAQAFLPVRFGKLNKKRTGKNACATKANLDALLPPVFWRGRRTLRFLGVAGFRSGRLSQMLSNFLW
jgi:hypothetical protein